MAWNRPSEDKAKAKVKDEERNVHLKGLVAGAVVVVGAAVAAWWLWPVGESTGKTHTPPAKPARIKEVTPAPVPKAVEQPRELTADEKRLKQIADIEKRWEGKEMPIGIKTHLYYLKNPPKKQIVVKVPYDYLTHVSERDIAGVGLAKPGTFFAVQPEYGESFDNDFATAFVDRITISPDDTEEVRETKENVEAMKKEIARLVREEGKKPSEIMNEHAKTLYELGRYHDSLMEELNKVRYNPEVSDDDARDFWTAANQMLKSKGLEEVKIPDFTKRAMIMQLRQKRLQKKETK